MRNRSIVIEPEMVGNPEVPEEVAERVNEMFEGVEDFTKNTDLVVYLAMIENASNNTVARLTWNMVFGLGNDMPWFVKEKPTVFISLVNPYHLYDVPMIGTYINTYHTNDVIDAALMEKLTGRSEFTGVSPVDPTCGMNCL